MLESNSVFRGDFSRLHSSCGVPSGSAMIYNANTIPHVESMFVRKITPTRHVVMHHTTCIMEEYTLEDVGLVEQRFEWDEDIVDCSGRMLGVSVEAMCGHGNVVWTVFPSRRWRNFRLGNIIHDVPNPNNPLLYIGNPVTMVHRPEGLHIGYTSKEFTLRSGMELGY